MGEPSPKPERYVGLVRVFDQLSAELLRSQAEVISKLDGDDERTWRNPIIIALLNAISAICSVQGPLFYHSVARVDPGLRTVTIDRESEALIGLHFDSWEGLPLGQLHTARNRICVNLGAESRYLIFVNVTAADMLALLRTDGHPISVSTIEPSIAQIGRAFLEAYRDYPVVRLKIRPGEAYIAPTENILHDGSSEGATVVNSHVTFRGHFSLEI